MQLTRFLFEKFILFCKIHYFKDEPFVEFEIRVTLNYCNFQKIIKSALDAPFQGESFYVEKIMLASKLREL